jgi:hypothetical protein
MNANLNTRVIDLTTGDLIDIIVDALRPKQAAEKPSKRDENIVHGISGIANLLGCSKTMVHEYRKKGWIEPEIKQTGRKIVCDSTLALELFGKRK